ncbi:ABC transporter transmembrane domain-containing protein [Companilactobacillus heilongjiangensis]|uniref:ABC transporter ATP-binding protein n=1 Tax=Companilactobacillus heilongjiangensis TaxID=1074467 RepID=A0A0K2LB62_9LACO|nr:ABC transporter ATP-binding protein [Companilactobacillus heilongjiangensis]ALB28542.1 hypothetical protein JP39_03745 [Companilactobacillus heilongjiangensis]
MTLLHFLKFAKKKMWILLLLIPISSGVEISVSYLLQVITDIATGKSQLSYGLLIAIVICYILIDTAVYFIGSYLQQTTLNQIINNVRNRLLTNLFKQNTGIGNDVQKITNDYYNDFSETVPVLRDDYLQGTFTAYKQICQLVIALTLSIMIKPTLTLIIVLLCVPGIFLPFYQQSNLRKNKQNVIHESKLATSILQDATNGLRTIQVFNIQRQLHIIFQSQNQHLLIAQNNDQLTRKKVGAISQFMNDFLYLGTWIVGIYFVLKKEISLGQLVAFSQLMIFISEPIQTASGIFSDIIGGKTAATKLDEKIQDTNVEIKTKSLQKFDSLTYQDVSFTQDNKSILKQFNLTLKAQQHYLLVGKSGSGKTTLINLPFNSKIAEGQITLNEQPINSYSLNDVFQHLGLLEQQAHIFDASLKDNLTLFNSKYSDEQCFAVLQKVGLTKYANPKALNQHIDSHSGLLSGGEKRRLALGRLLLRQTEFNLFDEPLTGVDPHTSQEISQILTNLDSGWLIVTHQYDEQLFHNADSIIILDNGGIKATGDYNDVTVNDWLHKLNLLTK